MKKSELRAIIREEIIRLREAKAAKTAKPALKKESAKPAAKPALKKESAKPAAKKPAVKK